MHLEPDASSGSRSAVRRTRSDEPEGQPSRVRVRLTPRQAIDRIRAAESEEEYDEALSLCTQALSQDDLADTSRLRILLKRSSLQCKVGNVQEALKDARAAVLLAPNSADAYIGAAKTFHHAEHLAKARQALRKAAELNGDQENVTGRIIDRLLRQWASIKLPGLGTDVLLEIFGYLDTVDLYTLLGTCKQLKSLLNKNPSIWSQQVILRGSLPKVARQWKRLSNLVKNCEVHTLELSISSSPDRIRIHSTTIYKTFPFKTLTVLKYHSKHRGNMDFSMWHDLIVGCKKLKVLRFVSLDGEGFAPRLKVNDPLSSCRLEVFDVAINTPRNMQTLLTVESYVNLVSEAKEIQIAIPLPIERMQEMIRSAMNTVKVVKLDREKHREPQDGVISSSPSLLVLSKAKSLHLNWPDDRSLMNVRAPSAQNLVLLVHHGLDEVQFEFSMRGLLESCAPNLKEIHVVAGTEKAANILDDWLKEMNLCETLSVKLESGSTLPNLWSQSSIASANESAIARNQILLPNLRKLKIEGDASIKGGELVAFIRLRQTLKVSTIETLELLNCENIGSEAVAWLRRTVPQFMVASAPRQRVR